MPLSYGAAFIQLGFCGATIQFRISRVIPIANAAVNIKAMMTQFEPKVSMVTRSRFPSIGINQTSGRQGGGRINRRILPRMAGIPAAGQGRLPDPHGLIREAITLGTLASL